MELLIIDLYLASEKTTTTLEIFEAMRNYPEGIRRRTTRGFQEVERIRLGMGPNTPPEVKQLFDWLLRKEDEEGKEIECPELSEKFNYHVRLNNAVVEKEAESTSISHPIDVIPSQNGSPSYDLSGQLDEILSPNGHRFSYPHLAEMEPPSVYDAVPTEKDLKRSFEANNYIVSDEVLFSVAEAIRSGRPLLVTGPAGVGKTELAVQIAIAMGLNPHDDLQLHNLFCTPGTTEREALYEWNDAKRLMDLQLLRELTAKQNFSPALVKLYKQMSQNSYSERYLTLKPVVRACIQKFRTVCLLDEVDKTYPEFDSVLLSLLESNYYDVPEYGRIGREKHDPKTSPIFVLTSNEERELSGPLSRRCVPVFLDYLPENQEAEVLNAKCDLDVMDAGAIANFFNTVRMKIVMQKPPSTAEAIRTADALVANGLEPNVQNLLKLNCHWCKYRRDSQRIRKEYWSNGSWATEL